MEKCSDSETLLKGGEDGLPEQGRSPSRALGQGHGETIPVVKLMVSQDIVILSWFYLRRSLTMTCRGINFELC